MIVLEPVNLTAAAVPIWYVPDVAYSLSVAVIESVLAKLPPVCETDTLGAVEAPATSTRIVPLAPELNVTLPPETVAVESSYVFFKSVPSDT